jgi:hypothetical protein
MQNTKIGLWIESSESTDDGQIHLEADEVEELEAVHVRHAHVSDDQVELLLPCHEHPQRRLCIHHRRCCIAASIIRRETNRSQGPDSNGLWRSGGIKRLTLVLAAAQEGF